MDKTEGFYGKVVNFTSTYVIFEDGSQHCLQSAPKNLKAGDFLLIDKHGRKWIKQ